MNCHQCHKELTADDKGAYLKFWDRKGEDMICVACLAGRLRCSEEYLRERIQFLKDSGCTLFPDSKKQK